LSGRSRRSATSLTISEHRFVSNHRTPAGGIPNRRSRWRRCGRSDRRRRHGVSCPSPASSGARASGAVAVDSLFDRTRRGGSVTPRWPSPAIARVCLRYRHGADTSVDASRARARHDGSVSLRPSVSVTNVVSRPIATIPGRIRPAAESVGRHRATNRSRNRRRGGRSLGSILAARRRDVAVPPGPSRGHCRSRRWAGDSFRTHAGPGRNAGDVRSSGRRTVSSRAASRADGEPGSCANDAGRAQPWWRGESARVKRREFAVASRESLGDESRGREWSRFGGG